MSKPYTFLCAILGTDTVFTVTLDDTESVAHLKTHIKEKNEQILASCDAHSLILYKVKLDVSKPETFREVVGAISRDSIYGEELDYPFSTLLEEFKESDLPEMTIHILVKLPAAPPPILVRFSKLFKQEASAPLERDTLTERRKACGMPPHLTGPGDPVLDSDFLLAEPPLAFYSDYWGKGIHNIVENGKEFRLKSPELPPLYIFDQYNYMRERIDFFRSQPQNTIIPPGVAIVGTPGIGISSFLDYYLACELSQSKPAVYHHKGTCYIFVGDTNGCRVYSTEEVPSFSHEFHNILCLVDADTSIPVPGELLLSSPLFVVMATSKKAHTNFWMNQRASGDNRLFVLNPPSEDELVHALRIQSRINPSTPDDKIRLAFRLYGPNMRTLARVLLSPGDEQSIQDGISKTVKALKPSTLKTAFMFRTKAFENISHTIVTSVCLEQPKPGEEEYLADDLPEVTFAGPVVWEAMVRAYKAVVYAELTHVLSLFAIIPQARGFGGWLWRQWVHAQMIKGGDFTLPQMYSRQTEHTNQDEGPPTLMTISIPPLTPLYYNDKEEVSYNTSKYFIPNKKSNAAFDSFLFHQAHVIGLQITIEPTHSLNEDLPKNLSRYIRDLTNNAAKTWLVAVIPKGQSFTYTPQPSDRDLKQFCFFKMELNLPDGIPPEIFDEDEMTKRLEDMTIYPEDGMTKQPQDSEMPLTEN